jgi:hypothetical protein
MPATGVVPVPVAAVAVLVIDPWRAEPLILCTGIMFCHGGRARVSDAVRCQSRREMARLAIAARSSDGHVPVAIAIVVVTPSFKRFETCKLSLHGERYRGRGRHLIRAPRGRRLGHGVVVKHGE